MSIINQTGLTWDQTWGKTSGGMGQTKPLQQLCLNPFTPWCGYGALTCKSVGKIVVVLPFKWNCPSRTFEELLYWCLKIWNLGIYCEFFASISTRGNWLNSLHTGKFVYKLVGQDQDKDVNNADFFSGVSLKDIIQFLTGRGSCPQKFQSSSLKLSSFQIQILVLIV